MPNEQTVEQRLTALEQAVAELQRQQAVGSQAPNWLEKVIGSVTDDRAFAEVLEYGRAFRAADRPPDETGVRP